MWNVADLAEKIVLVSVDEESSRHTARLYVGLSKLTLRSEVYSCSRSQMRGLREAYTCVIQKVLLLTFESVIKGILRTFLSHLTN